VSLPDAVSYLPANSQAVFGMNVAKFVASPVYAKFEEKHGEQMARDLADFIAQTGVDPRRDVHYVVAAGAGPDRPKAAVIAGGQFNTAAITSFIHSKTNPIRIEYQGATVLMVEEPNSAVQKGVAFLSDGEIAAGDLESLKAVLDVRAGTAPGVLTNAALAPL